MEIQGFSGDSGPATSAELDSPQGIAVDAAGNLYIADTHNHRIRMVSAATGILATIAGTGIAGYSGDRAAALSAKLDLPTALAFDPSGLLYLADTGNHRIRCIFISTGIITTTVGDGIQGNRGDYGPAIAASVDAPSGIAIAASGDLYVADARSHSIRVVSRATGIIAPFVMSPSDIEPDEHFYPRGITLDGSDTLSLYVADSTGQRVLRITSDGAMASSFAGQGIQGFAGDDSASTGALFDSPQSTAMSSAGLVTIVDTGNRRIRQVDATGLIHTLPIPDGGAAEQALSLSAPSVVQYGTGSITAVLSPVLQAMGSVVFSENVNGVAVALGTGALTRGSATLSLGILASGPHQISAKYSQGPTSTPIESPAIKVTVTPALVAATAYAATALYGQGAPALSGSVTGILPQDVGLVAVTFTTVGRVLSPPGSYPISATLTGRSAANYELLSSAAGALIITQAPTLTSLTGVATQSVEGATTALKANAVSTTAGVPTGHVTFLDGSSSLGSTTVDSSGTAGLGTTLVVGTHLISAFYEGDLNFLPSTSPGVSAVVSPAVPADFTVSVSGATSQTVNAGGSAAFQLGVTPLNGSLNSPIQLAVSGLPLGANASFSPTIVVPGSSAVTVTMTIQIVRAAASKQVLSAIGWPAILLCFSLFLRNRRTVSLCLCLVLMISGCGDRVASLASPASSAVSYPLTVTGTATSSAGTPLQHSVSVTLTVQ